MNASRLFAASLAVLSLIASQAIAGEPDMNQLYSVTAEVQPAQLAAGAKGTLVIAFKTAASAHISDEAPLKIALSGKNVAVDKAVLRYQDSVAKKTAAKAYPDPRFEIPFTAQGKGLAEVDAKMTFFVCSADLCSRQQKNVTVPVTVK